MRMTASQPAILSSIFPVHYGIRREISLLGGYAAHGQKTLLDQFAQGPRILGVAEMKTLTSIRLIRFSPARSH